MFGFLAKKGFGQFQFGEGELEDHGRKGNLDISPSRTYVVEGGVCRKKNVEVEGFGCFGCVRDFHIDFGWPWFLKRFLGLLFLVCELWDLASRNPKVNRMLKKLISEEISFPVLGLMPNNGRRN